MLTRLCNRLAARHLLWRARRAYAVESDTGTLVVAPGVLDPVATKVGQWLAGAMRSRVQPGERWIDMGCGTGIVGLAMSEAGADVTCLDIDPTCVRNARVNAELRGHTLTAIESDLFAGLVGGERAHDGVVYNVPFWPGENLGRPFGRAMYAGRHFDAIRRYRSEADRFGVRHVLVALSESGPDHASARAAFGPHTVELRGRVRGEWLLLLRAD